MGPGRPTRRGVPGVRASLRPAGSLEGESNHERERPGLDLDEPLVFGIVIDVDQAEHVPAVDEELPELHGAAESQTDVVGLDVQLVLAAEFLAAERLLVAQLEPECRPAKQAADSPY